MALIEAYEEQYHGLVKSINEKLDRIAKLGPSSGVYIYFIILLRSSEWLNRLYSSDKWSSTISGVEQDVEDADELIGKLDVEVRR
jgi:hypothetical protein